jgi:pSer/pThr/pTyr-binding forkhead associated (FHA) protein
MGVSDFPLWFQIGSYGGLVCCALVGTSNIFMIVLGQRTRTRQKLWITVISVLAALLLLPALLWFYLRFLPLQAHLAALELALVLIYVAFCGWVIPLGATLLFTLFGPVQASARQVSSTQPRVHRMTGKLQPPRYQPDVPAPFVFSAETPWGWLEHRGGKFQGQRLALKRAVATLGRDGDCDIWIDDEMASRHHAELAWDNGRVCLTDCGSLNGTLLNGKRVRGTVLVSSEDLLAVGEHRFLFVLADHHELSPDDDPLSRHTWRSTRDLQGDVSNVLPVTTGLSEGVRPAVEPHSPAIASTPLPVSLRPLSGISDAVRTPPSTPISPATATCVLRVRDGSLAGQNFVLDRRPVLTIGQESGCNLHFPLAELMPLHALLLRRPEGDYLEDVSGANGVLVNEQPLLSPRLLKAGDVIRLVSVSLEYLVVPMVSATPFPPLFGLGTGKIASTPFPSSRLMTGPTPLRLPSRRKE